MGGGYFVFMGIMLLVALGALIAFGIGVAVVFRKADSSKLAVAWLMLSVPWVVGTVLLGPWWVTNWLRVPDNEQSKPQRFSAIVAVGLAVLSIHGRLRRRTEAEPSGRVVPRI